MNCTFVVAASAVYNAVFCVTDPRDARCRATPGCYRPMRIIAPPGSVVNVRHPGPVGRRQHRPAAEADRPPARRVRTGRARSRRRLERRLELEPALRRRPSGDRRATTRTTTSTAWARAATALQGRQRRRDHAPLELPQHADRGLRAPLSAAHRSSTASPPTPAAPARHRGGLATQRTLEVTADEITFSALFDRSRIAADRPLRRAARPAARSCSSAAPARPSFRRFDEVFGVASPTKFTNVVLRRGDELRYLTPGRRRLRRPGRARPRARPGGRRRGLRQRRRGRARLRRRRSRRRGRPDERPLGRARARVARRRTSSTAPSAVG